jgi:hypothetical protein
LTFLRLVCRAFVVNKNKEIVVEKKRLNVTLAGDAVLELEELRLLLEKKLMQRLSLAQVVRRLVVTELNNIKFFPSQY